MKKIREKYEKDAFICLSKLAYAFIRKIYYPKVVYVKECSFYCLRVSIQITNMQKDREIKICKRMSPLASESYPTHFTVIKIHYAIVVYKGMLFFVFCLFFVFRGFPLKLQIGCTSIKCWI